MISSSLLSLRSYRASSVDAAFATAILGKYGFTSASYLGRLGLVFRDPETAEGPEADAGQVNLNQFLVQLKLQLQSLQHAESPFLVTKMQTLQKLERLLVQQWQHHPQAPNRSAAGGEGRRPSASVVSERRVLEAFERWEVQVAREQGSRERARINVADKSIQEQAERLELVRVVRQQMAATLAQELFDRSFGRAQANADHQVAPGVLALARHAVGPMVVASEAALAKVGLQPIGPAVYHWHMGAVADAFPEVTLPEGALAVRPARMQLVDRRHVEQNPAFSNPASQIHRLTPMPDVSQAQVTRNESRPSDARAPQANATRQNGSPSSQSHSARQVGVQPSTVSPTYQVGAQRTGTNAANQAGSQQTRANNANQDGSWPSGANTPNQGAVQQSGTNTANQVGSAQSGTTTPNQTGGQQLRANTPNLTNLQRSGTNSANQVGSQQAGATTQNHRSGQQLGTSTANQAGPHQSGGNTPNQFDGQQSGTITPNQIGMQQSGTNTAKQDGVHQTGLNTPDQLGVQQTELSMANQIEAQQSREITLNQSDVHETSNAVGRSELQGQFLDKARQIDLLESVSTSIQQESLQELFSNTTSLEEVQQLLSNEVESVRGQESFSQEVFEGSLDVAGQALLEDRLLTRLDQVITKRFNRLALGSRAPMGLLLTMQPAFWSLLQTVLPVEQLVGQHGKQVPLQFATRQVLEHLFKNRNLHSSQELLQQSVQELVQSSVEQVLQQVVRPEKQSNERVQQAMWAGQEVAATTAAVQSQQIDPATTTSAFPRTGRHQLAETTIIERLGSLAGLFQINKMPTNTAQFFNVLHQVAGSEMNSNPLLLLSSHALHTYTQHLHEQSVRGHLNNPHAGANLFHRVSTTELNPAEQTLHELFHEKQLVDRRRMEQLERSISQSETLRSTAERNLRHVVQTHTERFSTNELRFEDETKSHTNLLNEHTNLRSEHTLEKDRVERSLAQAQTRLNRSITERTILAGKTILERVGGLVQFLRTNETTREFFKQSVLPNVVTIDLSRPIRLVDRNYTSRIGQQQSSFSSTVMPVQFVQNAQDAAPSRGLIQTLRSILSLPTSTSSTQASIMVRTEQGLQRITIMTNGPSSTLNRTVQMNHSVRDQRSQIEQEARANQAQQEQITSTQRATPNSIASASNSATTLNRALQRTSAAERAPFTEASVITRLIQTLVTTPATPANRALLTTSLSQLNQTLQNTFATHSNQTNPSVQKSQSTHLHRTIQATPETQTNRAVPATSRSQAMRTAQATSLSQTTRTAQATTVTQTNLPLQTSPFTPLHRNSTATTDAQMSSFLQTAATSVGNNGKMVPASSAQQTSQVADGKLVAQLNRGTQTAESTSAHQPALQGTRAQSIVGTTPTTHRNLMPNGVITPETLAEIRGIAQTARTVRATVRINGERPTTNGMIANAQMTSTPLNGSLPNANRIGTAPNGSVQTAHRTSTPPIGNISNAEQIGTAPNGSVQSTHRTSTQPNGTVSNADRIGTSANGSVQTVHRTNTQLNGSGQTADRISTAPSVTMPNTHRSNAAPNGTVPNTHRTNAAPNGTAPTTHQNGTSPNSTVPTTHRTRPATSPAPVDAPLHTVQRNRPSTRQDIRVTAASGRTGTLQRITHRAQQASLLHPATEITPTQDTRSHVVPTKTPPSQLDARSPLEFLRPQKKSEEPKSDSSAKSAASVASQLTKAVAQAEKTAATAVTAATLSPGEFDRIVSKVYRELERKLKSDLQRRGL